MLFWIFVILAAVGGLVLWFNRHNATWTGINIDKWAIGTVAFSGIIAAVMLIIILTGHVGNNGYIASMNTRYDMLTYQYENNFYENDNDVGKRELIEDIQAWNEDLAKNQELQKDFWLGIFYANIYDQFEYIELK